jgi:hypothetical protein
MHVAQECHVRQLVNVLEEVAIIWNVLQSIFVQMLHNLTLGWVALNNHQELLVSRAIALQTFDNASNTEYKWIGIVWKEGNLVKKHNDKSIGSMQTHTHTHTLSLCLSCIP